MLRWANVSQDVGETDSVLKHFLLTQIGYKNLWQAK